MTLEENIGSQVKDENDQIEDITCSRITLKQVYRNERCSKGSHWFFWSDLLRLPHAEEKGAANTVNMCMIVSRSEHESLGALACSIS